MFRFEEAGSLYALLLIPPMVLLIYMAVRYRRQQVNTMGNPRLIKRLIPDVALLRVWIKRSLLLLSLAFLCVAWANPQWGTKKEKVKAQSADVFIALDISQSMMAADITPNRLERSKRFVQKLIRALRGNRIGLIFFAGGAYLQMPLSDDYAAAELFVKSANTNQAGTQGTAIGEAITLAGKVFDEESPHQRAVIIISDGEDHDQQAIDAVEEARGNGLVAYTVAVGTEDGAFVPFMDRGRESYKKDEDGNPVKSSVNINYLQQIAKEGGGEFFVITQGEDAIRSMSNSLEKLEKREVEQKSFSEYNAYFQYFLFFALLMLLIEYLMSKRFRPKIVVALFLILCSSSPLSSQSAHEYLLKGDFQYDNGAYELAEEAYRKANETKASPQADYNLGNSLYEMKRIDEAISAYEQAANSTTNENIKANALHNLGNAYFKGQKYKDAYEAYKSSLALNPEDEGTKVNLMAAKQMMKLMQQQQQQQQEQQQNDENNQENQEQQQQQQSGNEEADNQNESQAAQDKQELDKEDARKLLEIIDNEEQKVQEKLRKKGNNQKPRKDW